MGDLDNATKFDLEPPRLARGARGGDGQVVTKFDVVEPCTGCGEEG
jgi:hypothetical protein